MKILPKKSVLRSDPELLQLIQQGDDQALRDAFTRYANVCFAAAITLLKSRELSTGIVMEIFKAVRANATEIKDLRVFIFDKAKELTLASLHELARKYFEEKESYPDVEVDRDNDQTGNIRQQ
jgi:hypothetical protein